MTMSMIGPQTASADRLHADKYRQPGEDFREAMNRVAFGLRDSDEHYHSIREILNDMRFMPGGRIQNAIGSLRETCGHNCLSGSTKVLTREFGIVEIETLSGTMSTFLDGSGNWVGAQVFNHGVQGLHAVKLTHGRKRLDLLATGEHGWIVDGERRVTKDLLRNDRIDFLAPSKRIADVEEYDRGVVHGLVYGDGSKSGGGNGFQIRLCADHSDLRPYLDGFPVSFPPSYNGDPMFYFFGENIWTDLKSLPRGSEVSDSYLLGFIRGWIAADGCVSNQPELTICGDSDEEAWLDRWGELVGFSITGSSALAGTTNYGRRNKESRNIRFDLRFIEPGDLLVKRKRDRLVPTNAKGWRVHTVSPDPVVFDEVFCPSIPTTGSFALAGGVHSANCFVSGPIADSLLGPESIMQRQVESVATLKMGGGIGYDFSTLRPKGDPIRSLGSVTGGPLSFMDGFNAYGAVIASAGQRRGAQMGILRVDHPDIADFIHAKQNNERLDRFNISVAITDEFMEAVARNGEFALKFKGDVYSTVDAVDLWEMIMRSTWDWAEPGVFFVDTVNRVNNLWFCETIAATNPCLDVETMVSTSDGFVRLGNVQEGDLVQTIEGTRAVKTVERYIQMPVFRVALSDGTTLRATAAHIFHVQRGKWFDKETRLDQVEIGDKVRLAPAAMPAKRIVDRPFPELSDREYGLIVGSVLGDGCYTKYSKNVQVACHANEQRWIDALVALFGKVGNSYASRSADSCVTVCSTEVMHRLDKSPVSRAYSHEKYLPIDLLNTNQDFLAGYIDGMVSTDGNVHMSRSNPMVRVASSSFAQLMMLKRALSCFGILARIYAESRKAEGSVQQIAGRNVTRTSQGYVLVVLGDGIRKLRDQIGLSHPDKAGRLDKLVRDHSLTGCTWSASVVSIDPDGIADVVDLYEPVTDTWVTDGVVSRGCGEQPLPPFGACLLGSFNLVKYVRKVSSAVGYYFDTDSFIADIPPVVRAMDNVIDRVRYPLAEQRAEALSKRRMGLGITGLANAAEACGYTYGTPAFIEFEADIHEILRNETYRASSELAKEKGSFPLFDAERYLQGEFIKKLPDDIKDSIAKNGIRNSHLTSIAPTGTISLCADNVSSGIEPVFSYSVQRPITATEGDRMETLEDYGVRVFGVKGRLADEVSADEHVNALITAQRYVDSAVSKCVAKGTLIQTNHGLLPVESLGDASGEDSFGRPLDGLKVIAPSGEWRPVTSHYSGGFRQTVVVRLSNGTLFEAAMTHKVMTDRGWMALSDLRVNDTVFNRIDVTHDNPGGAHLPPIGEPYRSSKEVIVPTHMTVDLAGVLGALCADGHLQESSGQVSLCHKDQTGEVPRRYREAWSACFPGAILKEIVDPRNGVIALLFTSRSLVRWIRDLIGYRSHDKHVPEQILRGSVAEQKAFLGGLSLDGYAVAGKTVVYEGRSERLAREVHSISAFIGYRPYMGSKAVLTHGYRTYGVRVEAFQEAWETRKNTSRHSDTFHPLLILNGMERIGAVPCSHPHYSALRGIRNKRYQTVGGKLLTGLGIVYDPAFTLVKVTSIDLSEAEVYDIEVEEEHAYLIDGVVSHNTINMDGRKMSWDSFKGIYMAAYEGGAKGCTTFNKSGKRTALLVDSNANDSCRIDSVTGRKDCA